MNRIICIVGVLSAFIVVVGMCAVSGVLLYNRDFVSEDQAQSIAYGRALRNCVLENKQSTCSALVLTAKEKVTMGPTDKGPDHWVFSYATVGEGKEYRTLAVVDLKGKAYTYEQSLEWQ